MPGSANPQVLTWPVCWPWPSIPADAPRAGAFTWNIRGTWRLASWRVGPLAPRRAGPSRRPQSRPSNATGAGVLRDPAWRPACVLTRNETFDTPPYCGAPAGTELRRRLASGLCDKRKPPERGKSNPVRVAHRPGSTRLGNALGVSDFEPLKGAVSNVGCCTWHTIREPQSSLKTRPQAQIVSLGPHAIMLERKTGRAALPPSRRGRSFAIFFYHDACAEAGWMRATRELGMVRSAPRSRRRPHGCMADEKVNAGGTAFCVGAGSVRSTGGIHGCAATSWC
jgi:hypothetical protein